MKLGTAGLASGVVAVFAFGVLWCWPAAWSFVEPGSGAGFRSLPISEVATRLGIGPGRVVLLYAGSAFFGFGGGLLAMLACRKSKYVTLLITPIAGLGMVASGLTVALSAGGVAAGGVAAVLAVGGAVLLLGAWVLFGRRNPLLDEPWAWFIRAILTVAISAGAMATAGAVMVSWNRGPSWAAVLTDPPPPALWVRAGGVGVLISRGPPGAAWTDVYDGAGVRRQRFAGYVPARLGVSPWRPGADGRGEQVLLQPVGEPETRWGLGLRSVDQETLLLGDVTTGAVRTLHAVADRRQPRAAPGWFAWTADGSRLVGSVSSRSMPVRLRALDPDTGATVDRQVSAEGDTEVFGFDGPWALVTLRAAADGLREGADASPPRLEVVRLNLETGEEQRVALPDRAYDVERTGEPGVWLTRCLLTAGDRLQPVARAWDWAAERERELPNGVKLPSAGLFDLLDGGYEPPALEATPSGRIVLWESGSGYGGYGSYGGYGGGYGRYGYGWEAGSSGLDSGRTKWLLASVAEGFVELPERLGGGAGLNPSGSRGLLREDRGVVAGSRNYVYRVLPVPPPAGGVELADLPALASVSDQAGWLDDRRLFYGKEGEGDGVIVWWVRDVETGEEAVFAAGRGVEGLGE